MKLNKQLKIQVRSLTYNYYILALAHILNSDMLFSLSYGKKYKASRPPNGDSAPWQHRMDGIKQSCGKTSFVNMPRKLVPKTYLESSYKIKFMISVFGQKRLDKTSMPSTSRPIIASTLYVTI